MQTNGFRQRIVRSIAAGMLAGIATPPLIAADSTLDPWMTDRYEVEVIVFRHLDQARNTPEQPAAAALIRSSPLDLYPRSESASAGPYAGPLDPAARPEERGKAPDVGFYVQELEPPFPDFVSLDNDGGELGRVYARLERLDAYEPILHRTWLQGARPADASVPFPVSADATGDFSLRGTLTLYKERYVHLEVKLDLVPTPSELTRVVPEPAPWPEYGDVLAPPDPGQVPLLSPDMPAYELRESRRIRGVNAQYFDHPRFGVIARISKIELDEESED